MAMNFERIKGQYGDFFFGGGLFLGALVLFLAVGLTSFSKYQADSAKSVEIAQELAGLKSRLAIINKLASKKASITDDSKLLDSVLPSESSVPIVMTEVQQIANTAGVSLTALQFAGGGVSASGAPSAGNLIRMQTSAAGSYAQIQAFLKSVETAGRLLIVESLRFSSTTTQPVTPIGETAPASAGITTITVTLDISSPTFAVKAGTLSSATSLDTPESKKLIDLLKTFTIYSPTVDASGVGKSNPFTQ